VRIKKKRTQGPGWTPEESLFEERRSLEKKREITLLSPRR